MYMSRIVFDPQALISHHLYDEHQALWKVFSDGPDRERDFLFRRIDADDVKRRAGTAGAAYLAVSERPPDKSELTKRLEVKEYAPRLGVGERIYFSLRVNPVRKVRDESGRQVRHDIVQDLRRRKEADGTPKDKLPPRLVLAEDAAKEWLEKRRESLGFELEGDSLMVERYARDQFRKSRGRSIVTVAALDMCGFATVTDSEALTKALYEGVGPAKAFGCGLLLVRRA